MVRWAKTQERAAWMLAFAASMAICSTAAAQGPADIKGEAIMKHPVATLALQYVDLIHAGRIAEAMKMASTSAQADFKKEPADEQKEIVAYLKKVMPTRAELLAGIKSGGILAFKTANACMLNIVRTEQTTTAPGVVKGSSTTVAIGFVMESGQWKLAH